MSGQNLPSDEAVHCIRYIHGPEINDWPPEDIIRAYLTDTDEGRALVRDAGIRRTDMVRLQQRAADVATRLILEGGQLTSPRDFHCLARDVGDAIRSISIDAAIARQEGEG